jgi:peptide/nickel transport system substrate-binding protein
MKAIGVKINIQNYPLNDLFKSYVVPGAYQIVEFAWVATPFVSSNQSIYCSYTDATNCGQNWTHSANSKTDQLLKSGASASSQHLENTDFNHADTILWQDMVTLPMYQKPQFWAWDNKLHNVQPNVSSVGVTWNAENWTVG